MRLVQWRRTHSLEPVLAVTLTTSILFTHHQLRNNTNTEAEVCSLLSTFRFTNVQKSGWPMGYDTLSSSDCDDDAISIRIF